MKRISIMDTLMETINEGRPENDRFERLHSQRGEYDERGNLHDIRTGQYVPQGEGCAVIRYDGKLVCQCCANCLSAGEQIGDLIFCRKARQWNSVQRPACHIYEFSHQRFDEQKEGNAQ